MGKTTILAKMQANGYRMTKVRQALLEIFSEAEAPLSLFELRHQLAQKSLKPARTTIYRELKSFVREGIVSELRLGKKGKRYELNDDYHHHHLFCTQCKSIRCVPLENHLEKIEADLSEQFDFQIEAHQLEFMGICAACQKNPSNK